MAGLPMPVRLTTATELDRDQAERDLDPRIFCQASMLLRRSGTIVPFVGGSSYLLLRDVSSELWVGWATIPGRLTLNL